MGRSILLLGTRNTSRSIMAAAYINHASGGTWQAHSAGARPAERVEPMALHVLAEAGIEVPPDSRPKSRDLFIDPAAPSMDVVVSLCEEVADEDLLRWPGSPCLLHWPVPDPVGSGEPRIHDEAEIYRAVLELIRARADIFLSNDRPRRKDRT